MPTADKPPRQWAAEIAARRTLEDRRAALNQVPANLRPLVETHLKLTWQKRKKQ